MTDKVELCIHTNNQIRYFETTKRHICKLSGYVERLFFHSQTTQSSSKVGDPIIHYVTVKSPHFGQPLDQSNISQLNSCNDETFLYVISILTGDTVQIGKPNKLAINQLLNGLIYMQSVQAIGKFKHEYTQLLNNAEAYELSFLCKTLLFYTSRDEQAIFNYTLDFITVNLSMPGNIRHKMDDILSKTNPSLEISQEHDLLKDLIQMCMQSKHKYLITPFCRTCRLFQSPPDLTFDPHVTITKYHGKINFIPCCKQLIICKYCHIWLSLKKSGSEYTHERQTNLKSINLNHTSCLQECGRAKQIAYFDKTIDHQKSLVD